MSTGFEVTREKKPERAFLVGVSLPAQPVSQTNEYLDELEQLVEAAGAVIAGRSVQARTRIDGATYIGAGKAEEIKHRIQLLGANLLVFDNDLSPAQARNLEKIFDVNVIDRTELILDIFARQAKTQQAKIQVELAQLQYALPRLTRLWNHLSRQAGGIGLRGPGETQLEIDRRRIHQRMGHLRRQLKRISRQNETVRQGRDGFSTVALVGYTNAGKSTLMRRLTGENVLVKDQLFATLDTTTRRMTAANGHPLLLVDTVGFIRNLPDHLRTSFRATLEDIAQADLYLHVVDASHAHWDEHIQVTDNALRAIEHATADTIHVFNKIDRADDERVDAIRARFPDGVLVSAAAGEGIAELVERVQGAARGGAVTVEVKLSAGDGRAISHVRTLLHGVKRSFQGDTCVLVGSIASSDMPRLESVTGVSVRYLF